MGQPCNGLSALVLAVGLVSSSCSAAPPAASLARPGTSVVVQPESGNASRTTEATSSLTADQRILHVLNRLGYGPRPGDLERVKRMGLHAYVEEQLTPRRISDAAADQALASYRTLAMSTPDLVREYPRPSGEVRQKRADGEMSSRDMMAPFPPDRRPSRILSEMQAAKVTRAMLSERQLEEVMVDFWLNHFNVYARKGPVPWMLPSYERDAIRPRALGRFRDLVVATARHPAMLYYLDNWMSTRPDLFVLQGPNRGLPLGLNENYARELMELHTLGVDGGYTQRDVVEVARCFTGWTIDRPLQGGGYVFRPRSHDQGQKVVLGQVIVAGGGEQDGLRVIDLLTRHPSTARFISTKLVTRFVGDDAPSKLVERVTTVFRQTDGDIRAVLATIFSSPEFFSAGAYRSKIKKPLEVVISAARAVDARMEPAGTVKGELTGGAITLARQVARLGEPLYEAQPPTGYPDSALVWVNTGALVGRMNFSLALTQARLPGVRVDLAAVLAGTDPRQPQEVLDRLIAAALHGEITIETRRILEAELDSPEITRVTTYDRVPRQTDAEKLAALVLGAPEFQRR
jgi:uncharacterized protein (DUF1800 family)